MSSIRLTQYSHGAGCGCKIAPDVLDGILAKQGLRRAISGLSSAIRDAKMRLSTIWAMGGA